MNKHQKKIYRLTKLMFQLQVLNNPDFDGDFWKYYKKIKWLYSNKYTSDKELNEIFGWGKEVLERSKEKH